MKIGGIDLLTIGHVARLYGITTKTLRHYDAIGLFKPVSIGQDNLYRLYAPEQLAELRRILFLRSMGLGLESIQELKNNGTLENDAKIYSLLEEKAACIQDEIADREKQLEAIHRMARYITKTGGIPMESKVVQKEAFIVVGMEWNSATGEGDIPSMWQRFIQRENEINGKLHPAVSYGICQPSDNEHFVYVAGYETDGSHVPEGMVKVTVPARRYAVFTHKGVTGTLSETYELIYSKWLQLQGLKVSKGIDFELYDDRFLGPMDEKSELDIYIPIE